MKGKKTEATLKEIIEEAASMIMNTLDLEDDALKGELCMVLQEIAATKIMNEMAAKKGEKND